LFFTGSGANASTRLGRRQLTCSGRGDLVPASGDISSATPIDRHCNVSPLMRPCKLIARSVLHGATERSTAFSHQTRICG
jgi:hypothetical protein